MAVCVHLIEKTSRQFQSVKVEPASDDVHTASPHHEEQKPTHIETRADDSMDDVDDQLKTATRERMMRAGTMPMKPYFPEHALSPIKPLNSPEKSPDIAPNRATSPEQSTDRQPAEQAVPAPTDTGELPSSPSVRQYYLAGVV